MRDPHRIRDTIELQLNNRQIVSFVIGSLVVLGVVFALGVMVGKQLAGGIAGAPKPGDPLAAIDAKEKVRTGEAPAAAPDANLTFAAELTKPKAVDPAIEPTKPAKPEKAEKADKKAKGKKEDAKAEAVADATASPEPAPAIAAEPKPEKPAAKEKEPAKRKEGLAAAFDKATSKGGEYCLQVASLPSHADAEKVVAKLAGKGYSGAAVVEADVPGKGKMYRVRVGSYATRSEADGALREFKSKSGMSALVANAR